MIRNLQRTISEIKWARKRVRKAIGRRLAEIDLPPITKEQVDLINSVWDGVHVDKRWISYYNMFREAGVPWTPCYVPANLHYAVIDLFYSDYNRCRVIEDKNLNCMLYNDVMQPSTLLRCLYNNKSGGNILLDENYHILDDRSALHLLSSAETLICKPAILSGGGRNIVFMDESMTAEKRLNVVKSMQDAVVQRIVKQHSSLSELNADSLNTMRLVTFVTKSGEIRLLSAVLRMGVGKSKVDNASSGGIFIGLDSEGYLRTTAHNLKNGSYLVHPSSGIKFCGHMIKGFDKCKEKVLSLAPRFYGQSRLIHWDMTVTADTEPLLIEANMNFGGCDIPQIANGPLFGDYTETMIKEVFSNRKNLIKSWLV